MKKITDRFLLGIISGIGGNLVKNTIEGCFARKGIISSTAKSKASGIYMKKSDINSLQGKLVGSFTDYMVGAGLGITCVYWLTLMGRDYNMLKGMSLGVAEWTAIYGVMSRFGATNLFPVKPKEALVSLLSHSAFGATKMAIATNLGDSRLFHPQNLFSDIDNSEEIDFNNGLREYEYTGA